MVRLRRQRWNARSPRRAALVAATPGLLGLLVVVLQLLPGPGAGVIAVAAAALLLATGIAARNGARRARQLRAATRDAHKDGLTGLGNRRRLQRDLEEAFAGPGGDRTLVLLDLDGFKTYNDTFGHLAGDALLARLGRRLKENVQGAGRAYRMGGDEFCVLLDTPGARSADLVETAAGALTERGEGFSVSPSHGAVLLADAADPTEALRIADRRMYADKDRRRPAVSHQARDLLLTVLHEADPALQEHLRDVTDLAVAVGRRLDLDPHELDQISRAAELHDIGKMAVPDAVLHKAGPLTGDELAFIHRHTLVGERILGAAPVLRSVARLVRHSHERWDGHGYPDGLAGESIPLGSRIIAVCDAYDAMTAARPYRPALAMDAALEELRRCAGTQFDPRIVEAFCAVAEAIRAALTHRTEVPADSSPAVADVA